MGAFCRANGLKYPTFRLWCEKLNNGTPQVPTDPGLVKLEVPATIQTPATGDGGIEIRYGSYGIWVPRGFDASNLTRILRILKDLFD